MPDATDIKAFLTIPEDRDPSQVRVRGAGSAYLARFRGARPIDLIKVSATGRPLAGGETLRSAEFALSRGRQLQVFYSRDAAIVVHDRGRDLIMAPTPFDSLEDVRAAVESDDLELVAGYEPIPGEPLIELEPLPGAPVTELEPLTGRPVMEIEPPEEAPAVDYVVRTCPGPPAHLARVLREDPYCWIHDRRLNAPEPPVEP